MPTKYTRISHYFGALLPLTLMYIHSPNAEAGAYDFELAYTLDVVSNQKGGAAKGTALLGNLDAMLTIDAYKAWGLKDTSIFVYALADHGGSPSADLIGDTQGIDNIEAEKSIKVYEAWFERTIGKQSIRFGLYDLNSEFDSIETAGLFINPSHGIGPDYSQSGRNGPSIFPTTSVSLRYHRDFTHHYYFQTALLDGVPGDPKKPNGTYIEFSSGDGWLVATEFGQIHDEETTPFSKWSFGAWYYTEPSTTNAIGAPIRKTNNNGLYVSYDRQLIRKGNEGGLSGFLRYGIANATINQIASYFGTGLVYTGVTTNDDQLGAAVAIANNSSSYTNGSGADPREINIEISYRRPITDHFTAQPVLQYVINPGSNPSLNDAAVAAIRLEITT